MFLRKTILFMMLVGLLWLPSHVSVPQDLTVTTGASLGGYTFTDDNARGYLTLENENVKVVWHYKIRAAEYNNRGGGNIYELYDKRTDPGMTRNLVAVVNSGTAGTGPAQAGIGGLGATYVYEYGNGVANSDNAGLARLVSRNHYIDSDGNGVFEATFIVRSNLNPSLDNYRVSKRWVVYPDGQIKLELGTEFLRSYSVSEPAYNFSFNRSYGWTQASAIRHNWQDRVCSTSVHDGVENHANETLAFSNIDQMVDRDNSLLHSQSFDLYGQRSGVAMRVKMDNGGQGFEGGGLFQLGEQLWGTTANPSSEYSNFSVLGNGHTLHYYGWWGGGSPPPDRFRPVTADTSWSDTIWIEMIHSPARAPSLASSPVTEAATQDSVTLGWATNLAASSQVRYWPASGTGSAAQVDTRQFSPRHRTTISGLMPGTTYRYEILNRDVSGEVSGGGYFTTLGTRDVELSIMATGTFWARYDDYLNQRLTVAFSVANAGNRDALNAQVLQTRNTAGVQGITQNTRLDNIPPGQTREMRVIYQVPGGVSSFSTSIFMVADDNIGGRHYFPEPPGV